MTNETPLREMPPINRLTPGQRECLRLVAQLQSSKQIARSLGISPYTVDQRVARACRTLGTATRADAALMVAEYEASASVESVLEPAAVDPATRRPPAFPQLDLGQIADAGEPQVLRDDTGLRPDEAPQANFPVPTQQSPINDMNFLGRLGWSAVVFASGIVVAGMLLASLVALKSLT